MTETRYITVPPSITVTDTASGKEHSRSVSFADFLKTRCNDAAFGKDLDGVFMSMSIRNHCSRATPGQTIGLELPQWEALCAHRRVTTQKW
jgi:hypothetical protein